MSKLDLVAFMKFLPVTQIAVILCLFSSTAALAQKDALFIDPSGNVGIGRSDPHHMLDVGGNISTSGGHLVFNNDYGIIDWGSSAKAGRFIIRTLNTKGVIEPYVDRLVMDASGNIGIGNYEPLCNKLQLGGDLHMDGNTIYFRRNATDKYDFVRWTPGTDQMEIAGWNGLRLGATWQNGGEIRTGLDMDCIGNCRFKRGIFTEGRISMAIGTIQQGGSLITTTDDLGLYARDPQKKVRLVTNMGDIAFSTKSDNEKGDGLSMIITSKGRVGIGTNDPQVPLSVLQIKAESGDKYRGRSWQLGWGGGAQETESYRWFGTCSIYASGDIVTSNLMVSTDVTNYSDIRIKKNIQPSSSSQDLETLKKIEIVDYKMIDTLADNHNYKKVVAQQVEKVYPNAIRPYSYYLPNIYRVPDLFIPLNDSTYKIAISCPHKLVTGDLVKLLCQPGHETIITVAEILSPTEFVAHSNTVIKNDTRVFVYGKEVDDLLTVDYDALSMLNISATQELVKMIATQQKMIASLQQAQALQEMKNAQLAKENTSIKDSFQTIENRLQRLEIKGGEKKSVLTASK